MSADNTKTPSASRPDPQAGAPEDLLDERLAVAVDHYRNDRLPEAEEDLRKIQSARADIPDVLHLLAVIALRTGRAGEAVRHLEKIVAAGKAWTSHYSLLGSALKHDGRSADAVEAYKKAVALDPMSAESHYNLGNTLKDLERLGEAASCYRRAVALSPDFAAAHYNLGWVLKAADAFDDAASAFREAIRVDGGDSEAHSGLGASLYSLGVVDDALASLRRALDIDPDNAGALAVQGVIRFEGRELGAAGRFLKKAAALDPFYDFGTVCDFGDEYHLRADPDSFERRYSALPQVAGAFPDPAGDGTVIMTSGDDGYFRQFGRALALSVDRHAPGHDFHLHVINPGPTFDDDISDLRRRMPNTGLTATTEAMPKADRLYFHVIRFVRLCRLLETTGRDVLHLDTDSLVRRPPTSLDAIDTGADLAVPMRLQASIMKYKVLISSLFVRQSPMARRFMRRFGAFLADCILEDRLFWGLDQTAFYIVYRMMRFDGEEVTVAPLPQALCDHDFNDDSEVWAAKGTRKMGQAYERAVAELLGAPE